MKILYGNWKRALWRVKEGTWKMKRQLIIELDIDTEISTHVDLNSDEISREGILN